LGFIFLASGLKGKLLRLIVLPILKFFFKKENVIFFQNSDDLMLFEQLRLVDSQKAYLVNGSGINLKYFEEKKPLSQDNLVFLLVARLLRDKGIFEYVEAAKSIKKTYKNVKFQIMGPIDKNPSAISKDQIFAWHSEGIIEYLGEQKDVRPFLAAAHVFVLPSYREGVPRSSLEAMATGRAIISTNTPGCKETVVEGKNGFLVPIKNADLLSKAMEKFILSPELVEIFGKESRKIAEVKFCVEKVNSIMLSVMKII
jgi:glycosyltransferase involved in cell wall biosynthesis